jgi:hypothetical protein
MMMVNLLLLMSLPGRSKSASSRKVSPRKRYRAHCVPKRSASCPRSHRHWPTLPSTSSRNSHYAESRQKRVFQPSRVTHPGRSAHADLISEDTKFVLDCRVGSRQPDAIYIRPRVEKEILLMWCTTIWRTTGEAGIVVLAERDPEDLMQPLVLQLVIH